MAATAAIVTAVAAVGGQTYQAIDANQQRQKAKGQAAAALREQNAAAQREKADAAAIAARNAQRQKTTNANGFGSTILTGPSGAFLPPVQRKTLLGQ